ncbi:hypothetical protein AB0C06_20465 [Micromonospora inaquosa]|uniref:Uncharacterized protein n=1 Tax=Micromonospora inaquosa TaxID=2203716 RepID=A0A3N9WS75_9ACTN|nr:hypothetical protein [Micromonospora inaquosa]RQX03661.1 hypothetical protein DLJ59_11765 [Micromonospora inaquosa]
MAVPIGFELRTPQDWVDFSVADDASENRVADEVWTRARESGFTEEQAGQYAEQLRRSVRQARNVGAVHATGTFQVYEDGALIATMLLSVVTPPATGDIIGALTAVAQPAHADGTWRRVSTAQIPAIGTVGRVHGIQNVTQEGASMRCAVMHTVVPLPGTANVLVVTGSSPNLAEAEEIFELFATITATLTFSDEGEAAALTPLAVSPGEVGS